MLQAGCAAGVATVGIELYRGCGSVQVRGAASGGCVLLHSQSGRSWSRAPFSIERLLVDFYGPSALETRTGRHAQMPPVARISNMHL